MLDKFGVEFPLKSKEIKTKMFNELLVKYGVYNVSKLLEIKKKKEETCLKNYGVKNPSQDKNLRERQVISYRENYFENYGVYHPMQRKEIFEKMLISAYKIVYYNDELFAQGTYELDFLNWCENHKIIDLISNGPTIEYKLNEDNHYYHADFFIESLNLIIEVKSTYTYNLHYEKNMAKKEYSKLSGYNFIFIIDKQYDELLEFLKNNIQN